MSRNFSRILPLAMCVGSCWATFVLGADSLHYSRDVEPILRKYCGGCHNDADHEGGLSLSTYDALMSGSEAGAVLAAGKPHESKLLQVIRATDDTRMPPEGKPAPSAEELAILSTWIEQGARKPAALPLAERIIIPRLNGDPQASRRATSICNLNGKLLAVGRIGRIDFMSPDDQKLIWSLDQLPGKVNQLRRSRDGRNLVVSTGIAGIGGQVLIIDIAEQRVLAKIEGHEDTIYCAALSPNGQYVATGSYDRVIHLWDWAAQRIVRSFTGHNGPIYDLDFDATGQILATASGDQTIKLWNVATGERLDTLGQGEGEMMAVRFSPDGKSVLGGGADRQIRLWKLVSTNKPAINPMLAATYAHENAVTSLEFASDARQVFSAGDDRSIKAWSASTLQSLGKIATTNDVPVGIATISATQAAAIDLSGDLQLHALPAPKSLTIDQRNSQKLADSLEKRAAAPRSFSHESLTTVTEAEPNDRHEKAMSIVVPAKITGTIENRPGLGADVDLFRFRAEKGESWIFEVAADRLKSPLDSWLDILDSQGASVLKTRLQALRESYFTFRGKDSSTSGDFRLHNWEEMELNEYLYSEGEVVKLWMYPRGPDSGFIVYPGFGDRFTYFDSTPIAHALGAPAYVVRELNQDEQPLPNGLPLFPVYYSNDDDAQRQLGRDSRLTFTAPATGEFLVRIRDARGFGSEQHKYELTVRRPKPDFEIAIKGNEMTMPVGSGREWQVTAKRLDGLESAIEVHLDGLPSGFEATNPIVIEPGQLVGYGCVFATEGNPLLPNHDNVSVSLRAKSKSEGEWIEHTLTTKLLIKITDKPEAQIVLTDARDSQHELTKLHIQPGETISARVIAKRNGFDGRIPLGKEDAGRNLPHGAYVDNIGLNGLLIVEGTDEREFFITASKITQPQQRYFHIKSDAPGASTSRPILLTITGENDSADR